MNYGAIFFAVFCLAAPIGATAAGPDPDEVYTVRGVTVDATAETAAAARDVALEDGQRRAYGILIDRLVPDGRIQDVPTLHKDDLAAIIQNFEVADEKTSGIRYIAQLTYRFNRNSIRRFLRQAGIPFAEAQGEPVLVLPVFRQAGAYLLWDNPNTWRTAWSDLPPSDGLVPVEVPKGGFQDIADISAEQAVAGDRSRITAIARRYGAASAALALARLTFDRASLTPVLEVSLTQFDPDGDDRVTIRSYTAQPGETSEIMIQRAAAAIAAQIQENWKTDNVLRFDRQADLIATIALGGLPDWVATRRILSEISFINRFQLVAISRSAASVRLEYFGDEERLNQALQRNGMTLERGVVDWVLRRTESVAPGQSGGPAAQ